MICLVWVNIEYRNEWLYPGLGQKRETIYWICVVGVGIWHFYCLLFTNGQVTGLDFAKEQVLIASSRQKLLSRDFYKNIEWVEGDAADLPFPDCQFDAITMGYGLRNVIDRCKAMQEMFRVLKPGAKTSVLDFNKSTQPFVSSFQEWVIDNVVVPVASGYGLAQEYEYLKNSVREFLTGKELEKLALEAGFSAARHYEIVGGAMGNLVATR